MADQLDRHLERLATLVIVGWWVDDHAFREFEPNACAIHIDDLAVGKLGGSRAV